MHTRTKRLNIPVNEMELAVAKCGAWRGRQSLAEFVRACVEQQVTQADWALAKSNLARGKK